MPQSEFKMTVKKSSSVKNNNEKYVKLFEKLFHFTQKEKKWNKDIVFIL